MRTIRVMFMQPKENDASMNRLVAWADPPYCHVEIEFDNNRNGPCLASSIYAGETVFMRERTYANPNYSTITLHVEDIAYQRIFNYCKKAAKSGVPFSSSAMYVSYLNNSWISACCGHKNGTFCSMYVTEALQAGNVMELRGIDARTMSPSLLYRILKASQSTCLSVVPYKMNVLLSMPLPQVAVMKKTQTMDQQT